MKQVLTSHDIKALVDELQYLIGARLNQVYDVNSRSICLKFDLDKQKKYLILDSGSKIYTLNSFSSIRPAPTSFCSKLRKHLNNKRISNIYRLRGDRVVVVDFGTETYLYSIYIELYASGNILILDHEKTILNLLHVFIYDENTKVKVKHKYPVESATQDVENTILDPVEVLEWFKKNRPMEKIKLKTFLNRSPLSCYGPVMVDHTSTLLGYNIKKKVDADFIDSIDIDSVKNLCENIKLEFYKPLDKKGFIIMDGDNGFDSVIPMEYEHMKNRFKTVYPSFEDACSVFFSELDKSKLNPDRSEKILKKQNKIIDSNERKVANISDQIDNLVTKKNSIYNVSEYIENNLDRLNYFLTDFQKIYRDKKIDIIDRFIETKYPDIKLLNIDFTKKKFTIQIDVENSIDHNVKHNIEFDFTKSIYKNITEKYSTGKIFKKKAERAIDIKNDIKKDIDKKNKKIEKTKQELLDIPGKKKDLWFEKYNWFISSDEFLVVSGKNADQNEELVKKHLDKHDLYVHSNVSGSGSCVIKNPDKRDIPMSTIEQAGHFVVCMTKSWSSGVGDKSWWVYPDQVSKTTESGEYVTKGSFIVRGKKNFVQQTSLELGLSVVFKIKDNSFLQRVATENVEYAIPMCGPYSSLKKTKFKVKLKPGTTKTTKIFNESITRFNKEANIYEKSALKKIHLDEYHRLKIGKAKVC